MERGFAFAASDAADGESASLFLERRAEFAEREFGVVTGGGGLDDGSIAFGEEAREKDGGFHLRAGHGHLVVNATEVSATNFERGEIVVSAADIGAHLAKRSDDALHGAFLKRIVAGDFGGEGLAGKNAGQETNRGTGIFGVERAPGTFEAVETVAGDLDD